MYKITLYDYCCNPICDGTESYFVDNLDDFEKNWKPIVQSESRIERYERSKNGEIVTDYHSDDEELNIVQRDSNSKVIEEKEFEKSNFDKEIALIIFYFIIILESKKLYEQYDTYRKCLTLLNKIYLGHKVPETITEGTKTRIKEYLNLMAHYWDNEEKYKYLRREYEMQYYFNSNYKNRSLI